MTAPVKLLAFPASKWNSLSVHARFVKIISNNLLICGLFIRQIAVWGVHAITTNAMYLRRLLYWLCIVVHQGLPF